MLTVAKRRKKKKKKKKKKKACIRIPWSSNRRSQMTTPALNTVFVVDPGAGESTDGCARFETAAMGAIASWVDAVAAGSFNKARLAITRTNVDSSSAPLHDLIPLTRVYRNYEAVHAAVAAAGSNTAHKHDGSGVGPSEIG